MKFEKLFEPISIGKVPIKNRIAMAPMAPVGFVDDHGGLTQRGIDYYTERAIGGVGLIITGIVRVNDIEPRFGRMFISLESFPSFSELAESVHYYGSRIFAQLTPGYGRLLQGVLIDQGVKPISASEIPSFWRPNVTTRPLTAKEIEDMVKALGKAATLLKEAGIDGIELQGYGGYLLDQFTTAVWNKRNDKYGGNLEERLRFPMEILAAIKDKAGSDFPVIYRYSVKHYMEITSSSTHGGANSEEAGQDIHEGLEMARLLERAGFDAIHVVAGTYESWPWAYPPNYKEHGCLVHLAAQVKGTVKIPVIAVARLGIPELAEQILKDRKADMIALGRTLLADPHWPKKVHEGKVGDIRPCTGCNDGCLQRIFESKPLSCAVNPATGKERLYIPKVVKKLERVLIAGGGIAGMEAARVAAIRGCEVTLYEKSEKLGGHLIAASVPDFKQDYRRLIDWYNTQLEKLGIEIKFQFEVTRELVKKEKPDKVIVATGSTPVIPNVKGIEKPMVASCIDLLLGRKKAGTTVSVIGGGLVGCETALWLARQGKKVTVVEMLPEMATGIFFSNRVMLLEMLRQSNVRLMPNAMLEEVVDEGIKVVDTNFGQKIIPCDTVALAIGLKPRRELYESLRKDITELYLVGDCREPRKILHAIWDAYTVAGG